MANAEWGDTEWNEAHFPADQLDTVGDTWGIRWRGMEKMRHRSYLRVIGKDLTKPEPISFLDIGCALCDFTEKAWNMNRANKVWAMDVSPTAVDWTKNKFPEFQICVGAAPAIPYDIEFDLIFFLEIMCYLNPTERVQAMKNIREQLKPGGKILFSGVLDGGVQHHTTEEVTKLIGDHFEIEKIHFNHWSLHRTIIENPLQRVNDTASRLITTLAMSKEEFATLTQETGSGPKSVIVRFLRALNPLSLWVFKSISWLARQIIGSASLARTFHWLSKLIRGSKNADEIVVSGIKT